MSPMGQGQPTLHACLFKQVKQEPVATGKMKQEPSESSGRSTVASSCDSSEQPALRPSLDKARYNKFNYRLRSSSNQIKEHYKELLKTKDQNAIDAFMDELIDSRGALPADTLSRKRKFVEEEACVETEGWISWAEGTTK